MQVESSGLIAKAGILLFAVQCTEIEEHGAGLLVGYPLEGLGDGYWLWRPAWDAEIMNSAESIFAPVVRGTFYRAVDPRYRHYALSGSRSAGRYSRPHEPTLYLSSSLAGVEAAMAAHKDSRAVGLETLQVAVEASGIIDLRDEKALEVVGIELADAIAPWQETVASGGVPRSWLVRDQLVAAGANGLIDPSRTKPGLWHLVLFRWNAPDSPIVRVQN